MGLSQVLTLALVFTPQIVLDDRATTNYLSLTGVNANKRSHALTDASILCLYRQLPSQHISLNSRRDESAKLLCLYSIFT